MPPGLALNLDFYGHWIINQTIRFDKTKWKSDKTQGVLCQQTLTKCLLWRSWKAQKPTIRGAKRWKSNTDLRHKNVPTLSYFPFHWDSCEMNSLLLSSTTQQETFPGHLVSISKIMREEVLGKLWSTSQILYFYYYSCHLKCNFGLTTDMTSGKQFINSALCINRMQ